VFFGIPWGRVYSSSFQGKLLLSEADTSLAAIVRTDSSLACNSIVIGKALAFTSFSVTDTLVGALNQGVGIVRGYDRSNPGETLRAGSGRAILLFPSRVDSSDSGVAGAGIISSA